MGYIKKRGKTWHGYWYDQNGERQRESLRTRDAQVAREKLRRLELASANPRRHSDHTLGQALTWYIEHALVGAPAGTVHSYKHKARWLITLLGADTPLSRLTRDGLAEYVHTRLHPPDSGDRDVKPPKPAARATVYKEFVVLRGALEEAEQRGLWEGDIGKLVPSLNGQSTPRDRWLTQHEYPRLMSELPYRRQFWLAVFINTGGRVGEIEGTEEHDGLTWERVRLQPRDAKGQNGWVRLPGAKTAGAWRMVPISDDLAWWLRTVPERDRRGLVVEPWPNYVRDLAAACVRAKMAPVTGNDLRRTFTSWLLQAGVNPLTVSKLLGHGSMRMVERVYGQLSLGTFQDAIAALPSWCATGVTDSRGSNASDEAPETSGELSPETQNAETFLDLGASFVPRDGIEPPTRGFSGRPSNAPAPGKLRAIRGGR